MAYISLDEMNTPAKAPAPTKTGGYVSLDEISKTPTVKTPTLAPIKGLGMTINVGNLQASNKLYANTLSKIKTPTYDLKQKDSVDMSKFEGQTIGQETVKQPSIIDKVVSGAKDYLTKSSEKLSFVKPITEYVTNPKTNPLIKAVQYRSAAEQEAASTIQKTIVDRQLVDIGKKLGIDKQIPLDTQYDPTTAKIRQEKEIADYVRGNYNNIKNTLSDPSVLPEDPELLGPAYTEVLNNARKFQTELGLPPGPKFFEVALGLSMLPIAGAFIAAPAATALGLGAWTLLGQAEHYFLGGTIADKISESIGGNDTTRDVLNLVEMFAVGKGLHSVYKASPKIAEKFTKDIITEYRPGTKVELSPEQVRDIFQTGTKMTESEKQLWRSLGLTPAEVKVAIKNGVAIDVPPEKIVSIVDKPYFEKLKTLFQIKSEPVVSQTSMGQKATVSNKALPGKGQTSIGKIAEDIMSETRKNITTHGPEVTMKALVENLGIEPAQAQNIIDVASTPTMTDDYALIHEETMAKIAPEESKYVSLDELISKPAVQVEDKKTIETKEVIEENKAPAVQTEDKKPAEQLKPVESEGKVKTSRLAERVMETLGNATEADMASLPTYKEMNIKSSVQKASEIVTKDTYKALNMLQGKEPLPEGVNEGTMFLALTQYAKLTGDSELGLEISKMAANEASLSFTAMGQNIRALADFNKDNPVNMIMKVEEARKKEVMKKIVKGKNLNTIKKNIVAKGKSKIENKIKIPKMKQLEDFINSIEC